ncbi:hypothetical protein OG851_00085 [Streptomyces sp. NBC_00161]|uniref:hypothetical protein n=1 Tax=Streptomyces sp. NBC_00161 TaxID=2975671 RepID=UPI00325629B0
MSRAHETPKPPLPTAPGVPSADLADRAKDGFARFMARWEDPDPDPEHDRAADGPAAGER